MNPQQLRRIVLRWGPIVLVLAMLGAGIAWLVTRNQVPQYQAVGRVLVLGQVEASALTLTPDEIIATDASLMTQPALLQRVLQDLHIPYTLEQLSAEVSVAQEGKTELIDVTVTDASSGRAAQVANAIMSDFISSTPQAPTAASQTQSHAIQVASPATQPSQPLAGHRLTTIGLGAFGGLLLGIILALALQYLDQGLVTEEDVRAKLGLPTLAIVPSFRGSGPVGSQRHQRDAALAAEAYRRLRTSILFSSVDKQLQSVVVTSVRAGEGKTRTAANLAGVMAAAGERTLLVDADMRRPMQHRIFGEPLQHGVSELLLQLARPGGTGVNGWHRTEFANLSLLSAGLIPPNPSELLASKTTVGALRSLEQAFDLVVVDTPPTQAVTDALSLAASASGTVLVIEAGTTTAPHAMQAIEALRGVGANVLGVVLNKARRRSLATYSYYYYYSAAGRTPLATSDGEGPERAWKPVGDPMARAVAGKS